MRIPLTIGRHDLEGMFRERETLLWLFFMPPLFFWFLGTVTGGGDQKPGEVRDAIAVVVPASAGFLAERLVQSLERSRLEVVRCADTAAAVATGRARRLAVPADFTDRVLRGERAEVAWMRQPTEGNELAPDYDRFRVAHAVYRLLAEVAIHGARAESSALTPAWFETFDRAPRQLSLRIEPAGKRRQVPTGFQQSIPGSLVMFTLTILLTGGGVPLVQERKRGLLRRLASAPLSRAELVFGKALSRLCMAAVQILFGVLLGAYAFGLDWGPDRMMLALVLAAWGGLCAMVGLLVGNLARSEGQAVGLGVAGSLVLAALGGCWWPIEITPAWMQQLAACLPTGWTMHAIHQLVTFQNGAASALGDLAALLVATAICAAAAARTFRYHG